MLTKKITKNIVVIDYGVEINLPSPHLSQTIS